MLAGDDGLLLADDFPPKQVGEVGSVAKVIGGFIIVRQTQRTFNIVEKKQDDMYACLAIFTRALAAP